MRQQREVDPGHAVATPQITSVRYRDPQIGQMPTVSVNKDILFCFQRVSQLKLKSLFWAQSPMDQHRRIEIHAQGRENIWS